MRMLPAIALALAAAVAVPAADPFPTFEPVEIDPQIGKVCYAVTLADVDGDGLQDIVAVTENRVLWYRNPTWEKQVIIEDQTPRDNVCIAAYDIDGDGQIDFALGAGWTQTGTIHWLKRGPSLEDRWSVHFIGEERWVHRMQFADVLGTGTPQLVLSPLNATMGDGVRLTALEIPADPINQRWRPVVMDHTLNRMHNHWHLDSGTDGGVGTLTASREGVHRIVRQSNAWSRTQLARGTVAEDPNQSGAGEIKTGRLKNGTQFLTTVEPMHGTAVVVYTPPQDEGSLWQRQVIAEGFRRGHALWTADLNGDGQDEIVFGHSDTPETFGVVAFELVGGATPRWEQHIIDAGEMATEDLVVGDLNGDGRPEIVAGGRATGNLKLYLNQQPAPAGN